MIDFIGKRKWYFLASGVIILAGIISLLVAGLNLGIEFTGGEQVTVKFDAAHGTLAGGVFECMTLK